MRQNQKWIRLTMTAALLMSVSFQTFGAGPNEAPKQSSYDAETLARLQDNIIEYDEIPNMVHEYNPAISEIWKSYEDTRDDYKRVITELESQYPTIKDTADGYISMGQMLGSQEMIAAGKGLDKSYKGTLQSMRDTVNKWDTSKRNTSEIRKAERQVTSGVQSAMIGYDSIRKNMPMLQTMIQLYERQYQLAQRQVQLGVGTQTDVLSAQKELLSAQAQYASLSAQEDKTRRMVCSLLGQDADANPEIRPIPEFDFSRIEGMNLEQDTGKAIGNNYTLISQRRSALGNTTSQNENRMKAVEEGDQKVTIEMQRLYKDVLDKQAAYQAASVGFEAATAAKDAADRQYQVGYISELQHIGTQISYYQKKAAFESANLNLLQAMETYDWAVLGFAAVD